MEKQSANFAKLLLKWTKIRSSISPKTTLNLCKKPLNLIIYYEIWLFYHHFYSVSLVNYEVVDLPYVIRNETHVHVGEFDQESVRFTHL